MGHLVISNRRIDNATFFENPTELEAELETLENVDTLIFVFWSWIVPQQLLQKYKCYGMHTGPLLEGLGKGGSPIDNLIASGVVWTTLCLFSMTEKLDDGKVHVAIPFFLGKDKQEVVKAIDRMLPDVIEYITAKQPDIPEFFKRIQ